MLLALFIIGLCISLLSLVDFIISESADSFDGFLRIAFLLAIPFFIGLCETHFTPNVEIYNNNKLIYKGNAAHVKVSSAGNQTNLTLRRVGFFSAGMFYRTISDNIVIKTTKDKNKWVWFGDDERK